MSVRVCGAMGSLGDVPLQDDWLSDAERDVLAGLHLSKRREEWRLGRWTARRAVAAAVGRHDTPAGAIQILAGEDGAPRVTVDGHDGPVSLSISHRAGRAFCVAAAHSMALGCDLELIEPRSNTFVRDYFTEGEQGLVHSAEHGERPLLANLVWAAKEAALKGLHVGLREDTRSVVVTWIAGGTGGWLPLRLSVPGHDQPWPGWWRTRDGFVYTVAADQPTECVTTVAD